MSESVLLVWWMIPEETKFYLVTPTPEELAILRLANGAYINGDSPLENIDAAKRVHDLLIEPEYAFHRDEDNGKWTDTEFSVSPENTNIEASQASEVIISGCYM